MTIPLMNIRIIKFARVKKLFNLDAQIIYRQAHLHHEVCEFRILRVAYAATWPQLRNYLAANKISGAVHSMLPNKYDIHINVD